MKQYHIMAAAALSLSAILPVSAQACSVVEDYRVPTSLELVGKSQLVLRGRVVGDVEGEDSWSGRLLVEPIEALKGDMPSGTIEISGSGLVPRPDPRGYGILSNPYELEGAHPLSYIGGCIRYMFPQGTTALFFIERDEEDGVWRPAGGPFSRWAEDVIADDAPWMVLARFYARVIEAEPSDRQALLTAERDRLRMRENDPVAALMVRDIERQLAGPNETWNAMMRRAIEGESDIPPGAGAEASASALADLVFDEGDEANGEEMECTAQEDGDAMNCEFSIEAQADAMEEVGVGPPD